MQFLHYIIIAATANPHTDRNFYVNAAIFHYMKADRRCIATNQTLHRVENFKKS